MLLQVHTFSPSDDLLGAILGATLFGISTALHAGTPRRDRGPREAHFLAAVAGFLIVLLLVACSAFTKELTFAGYPLAPSALMILVLAWGGAELLAFEGELPIQEVVQQLEQIQLRCVMTAYAGRLVELRELYCDYSSKSSLAEFAQIARDLSVRVSRRGQQNAIQLLIDAVAPSEDKFKEIVKDEISQGKLFAFETSKSANANNHAIDGWPKKECYIATTPVAQLLAHPGAAAPPGTTS